MEIGQVSAIISRRQSVAEVMDELVAAYQRQQRKIIYFKDIAHHRVIQSLVEFFLKNGINRWRKTLRWSYFEKEKISVDFVLLYGENACYRLIDRTFKPNTSATAL